LRKTAIGVAVLVRKDNFLLLIKRGKEPGLGQWSAPGGHLEFRESLEECGHREVREETNVSIKNLRFIGLTEDLHPDENRHGVTIWFEAEYQAGELANNSPDEVKEIRWVDRNAIPPERFLPFRQILEGPNYK
jgi:8-oxo-dGTP diphosphatase